MGYIAAFTLGIVFGALVGAAAYVEFKAESKRRDSIVNDLLKATYFVADNAKICVECDVVLPAHRKICPRCCCTSFVFIERKPMELKSC
jgi:hypothetical protein